MLLRRLIQEFSSVQRPETNRLTDSRTEEAIETVSFFAPYRWQDVPLILVEKHPDATSWFSIQAFHYYLPSFIKASIEQGDIYELYVSSAYYSFVNKPSKSLVDLQNQRLAVFSKPQLEVILEWLQWLLAMAEKDEVTYEEVFDAYCSVDGYLASMKTP